MFHMLKNKNTAFYKAIYLYIYNTLNTDYPLNVVYLSIFTNVSFSYDMLNTDYPLNVVYLSIFTNV